MISELPVVTVHIPPLLRPLAGGNEEVTASGDTVGEVLEAVRRIDAIQELPSAGARLRSLSWPDQRP